jgi:hypothetical protein
MSGADRVRLREPFNQAAERYERTRPGYPPGLFAGLARPGWISNAALRFGEAW